MPGRMRANCRRTSARCARRAFSLVELLIAIVIVVILIGITTTLMHGAFSMMTTTAEVSSAKRNAQDVFNILAVPMRNAALGIPPKGEDMSFYFDLGGVRTSPIKDWDSPIEVVENDSRFSGNVLKIAYSLPSGVKNGANTIRDFEGKSTGVKADLTATGNLPVGGPSGILPGEPDTRAFVTFPGINMHPLFVDEAIADEAELFGKGRRVVRSGDLLSNVVNPYQDINLVRAGVACVVEEGGKSVFCLLDVTADDPLAAAGKPSLESRGGPRVEGIKAVSFDLDPEKRYITAWVLVEESVGEGARNRGSGSIDGIRARWGPIIDTDALNEERYYEDFSMTWRIRNFQL